MKLFSVYKRFSTCKAKLSNCINGIKKLFLNVFFPFKLKHVSALDYSAAFLLIIKGNKHLFKVIFLSLRHVLSGPVGATREKKV